MSVIQRHRLRSMPESPDVMHATGTQSRVPFHRTIRGRMVLLVLATVAPLLIIIVVTLQNQLERYREEALQDALARARVVSARVDDHVQYLDSVLRAVAVLVDSELGAVDANDAKLRALQAGLPEYINSVSVLAPDGRMLNSSTSPRREREQLNFADRDYFREALARRRLALGEPVISRTSGNWILVAARSLPGPVG